MIQAYEIRIKTFHIGDRSFYFRIATKKERYKNECILLKSEKLDSKKILQINSESEIKSDGKWLLNVNYKHIDAKDVPFEIPHEPYKEPVAPEKIEIVKYVPIHSKQKHNSKSIHKCADKIPQWAKDDIARAKRAAVYNSHSNANKKPEEENGVKVRGIKAEKR